jgi:hypothetical protein
MYLVKRISSDYIKGLSGFLQVVEFNRPSSGFIMCPCKKSKHEKDYSSIKSSRSPIQMGIHAKLVCMDKAWRKAG